MERLEFDFDQIVDRRGTQCEKWDGIAKRHGRDTLLPFWVADMDFASPPAVVEALVRRAGHGLYGYTGEEEGDRLAVVRWFETRHRLTLDPDMLICTPGVVNSMMACVSALTRPGDGVVIQPPVYGPFFSVTRNLDRKICPCPLVRADGVYRMDLDALESAFREGARMWLLCSPHNPVGRVWEREELEAALKLADAYGVTVVSDEIHCDFVFSGHVHTPVLSLPGAERRIMLVSSTKTFNLAGLGRSVMIIADPSLRAHMHTYMANHGMLNDNNLMGMAAQRAAYEHGGPWLDQLLPYIQQNAGLAVESLNAMAGVRAYAPQGTYLVWIDMRGLGFSPADLTQFLIDEAGIVLSEGMFFGSEGTQFMRMNVACPRPILKKALGQLRQAIVARATRG